MKTEWEADTTQDHTVYEFEIGMDADSYKRPLLDGHRFFHGREAEEWVPEGPQLVDQCIANASEILGQKLTKVGSWWVVTIDSPVDIHNTDQSIGDHIEGFSHDQWSIILALNTLPEDAGGEFRLVDERGGKVVGPLYPHVQGRGLVFRSQHWHGIAPMKIQHDRVSLAQMVE